MDGCIYVRMYVWMDGWMDGYCYLNDIRALLINRDSMRHPAAFTRKEFRPVKRQQP